jgi:hypothetical protein
MAESELQTEGTSDKPTEASKGASDSADEHATAGNNQATADKASTDAAESPKPAPKKSIPAYVWGGVIVLLLSLELFAYGHNGNIRVCVGRKGITDFEQLDKPRKGNIASGYPFCVESLNLGMYSRSDEVAKGALDVACSRAATLLRGEKSECIRKDKDWIRKVDKSTIPPWDPRFYRRLFFLE